MCPPTHTQPFPVRHEFTPHPLGMCVCSYVSLFACMIACVFVCQYVCVVCLFVCLCSHVSMHMQYTPINPDAFASPFSKHDSTSSSTNRLFIMLTCSIHMITEIMPLKAFNAELYKHHSHASFAGSASSSSSFSSHTSSIVGSA